MMADHLLFSERWQEYDIADNCKCVSDMNEEAPQVTMITWFRDRIGHVYASVVHVRINACDRQEFVIGCIAMFSCILLLFANRHVPSTTRLMLNIVDVITAVAFMTDVILHMTREGVWSQPNAYLKSSWNRVAFIASLVHISCLYVIDSWLTSRKLECLVALWWPLADVIPNPTRQQVERYVFILRSARILRVIVMIDGVREILSTIRRSLSGMIHVASLFALLLLVFSIIGVMLFGGGLGSCSDSGV